MALASGQGTSGPFLPFVNNTINSSATTIGVNGWKTDATIVNIYKKLA
jgi:hypothetical protein